MIDADKVKANLKKKESAVKAKRAERKIKNKMKGTINKSNNKNNTYGPKMEKISKPSRQKVKKEAKKKEIEKIDEKSTPEAVPSNESSNVSGKCSESKTSIVSLTKGQKRKRENVETKPIDDQKDSKIFQKSHCAVFEKLQHNFEEAANEQEQEMMKN